MFPRQDDDVGWGNLVVTDNRCFILLLLRYNTVCFFVCRFVSFWARQPVRTAERTKKELYYLCEGEVNRQRAPLSENVNPFEINSPIQTCVQDMTLKCKIQQCSGHGKCSGADQCTCDGDTLERNVWTRSSCASMLEGSKALTIVFMVVTALSFMAWSSLCLFPQIYYPTNKTWMSHYHCPVKYWLFLGDVPETFKSLSITSTRPWNACHKP